MIRLLHRWPGLIAAVLLTILGLSGAILSVYAALEARSAPAQSVAELAARVVARNPGVTEIDRSASGQITAYLDGLSPTAQVIDPATGASLGNVATSPLRDWLIELHRSLFLSDAGRIVMALAAVAMLALAVSGLMLLAKRSGGWGRILATQRGRGRLHAMLARVTVTGLALSAVTALWMTAVTFGLVPQAQAPAFPDQVSGQGGAALAEMPVLQNTPITALDKLVFPAADDMTDVYTLKTASGQGYIDQGSGKLLAWTPSTAWDALTRLLTAIHTGRGAAVVGLILGLSALGLPVMSWTGIAQYLARRARRVKSAPAATADVVVLVASEGGTTWGFAETLRDSLTGQGLAVHVAALQDFAPESWPRAELALILAATYGAGEAPAAAAGFLETLKSLPQAPRIPVAVLGFGDRSFPDFCAFAEQISCTAAQIGWEQVLPLATVGRQSPQDFARWGRDLSAVIGVTLDLHHLPERPQTRRLTLISRRDYGQAVQAPTAILRFALPETSLWDRLTGQDWRFHAGDLLGILPEGTTLPRFYSLASGRADGFVEICVRKHPGGLCSGQLLALEPGDAVQAFLKPNRGFRPARGRGPVILIGAGTGIGPLAGFARANTGKRPMHLFFGLRDAASDLLYAEELREWLEGGHLRSVKAAFSRGTPKVYVQDELRRDAARLVKLMQSGAQILVCGGREMAAGVRGALEEILAPAGLSPALLRAEGRYAEDVY